MNISILGDAGKTARYVAEKALDKGHKVRVLTRGPDMFVERFNLETIKGSSLDGGKVMLALNGCEAAILCPDKWSAPPRLLPEKDVFSSSAKLVVMGMRKYGIKRLVVLSSLFTNADYNRLSIVQKLLAKTTWKSKLIDTTLMEEVVRQSGLDWTIARVGTLTDNNKNEKRSYWIGDSFPTFGVNPTIHPADIALALLDCVENPDTIHKRSYVVNTGPRKPT